MILIVEDEESISEPLASALEREGYEIAIAPTAAVALDAVQAKDPDLVLLDVMLPDGDGREILRDIRSRGSTPVIMLSARGEETDMVVGLELGADDYVSKPFRAAELIARIRAVLRRTGEKSAQSASALDVNDVHLDLDTRTVTKEGEPIDLTLKEFDLLRALMERAGRVASRQELMDEVWDPHWFGPTKTLDVHVSSLRKKLDDDPNEPRYIHTIRGVGFRFAAPAETSTDPVSDSASDSASVRFRLRAGGMSFHARLVLAAAYLLTAVVLVLEVPLALAVERRAISEFQSGALGNAAVIASQISGDVRPDERTGAAARESNTTVQRIVESRAKAIGARIVVVDIHGDVINDSAGMAARGTPYATSTRPEFDSALEGRSIDIRRRFSESVGDELLLVTVPVVDRGNVVGAVRVSESLAAVNARVHRTWLGLAAIGVIVVVAGLGLAWVLATSITKPVRKLERTAVDLGRGDLQARADVAGPEEIKTLAGSFNGMAERLSASLTSQRDFTANASHQLRTPLTGLKLRLESIEHEGGRAAEEARKAEAEADRLSQLVDDLLALEAASTGSPTPGSPVDLSECVREAGDRWSDTVARSGRTLYVSDGEGAIALLETRDVANVLDNLIENAIRYSPEGAEIRAEAGRRDGRSFLAVSDTGPGIPPEERQRVFERFFRGAHGRSAGGGTGLGLAIVEELTRRWGGEVRLGDGPEMRVEASFPAAPAEG